MVWAIKTLWIQHNKGRKFPIIIIITFFMDKSSRDTSICKVTALYCFIGILSHTTDVLKTSASYFSCFGFNLCCHRFHCNRSFLDTKLYSCPSHKKSQQMSKSITIPKYMTLFYYHCKLCLRWYLMAFQHYFSSRELTRFDKRV